MKRNLYLMYAITLLQGMVFYSSVATLYRQAVGVTIFQITLIESISLCLTIACELPWGILADRIGYKRSFVICGALFFVSKIVFWQARGFFGFLMERVLLAVVVSGLSGVDISFRKACGAESERGDGVRRNPLHGGTYAVSGQSEKVETGAFTGQDPRRRRSLPQWRTQCPHRDLCPRPLRR